MGEDRNTKQETSNSDLILFNTEAIDITIVYQYQRYYIIYLPKTQAAITIYNLLWPLLDHSGYSSTIPAITTLNSPIELASVATISTYINHCELRIETKQKQHDKEQEREKWSSWQKWDCFWICNECKARSWCNHLINTNAVFESHVSKERKYSESSKN